MKALLSVFVNATFYSSVMILLVLILRPILRQAPRRILCFLWLFVMARLLLPVPIESKLSLQPQLAPIQTIVEQLPETPYTPPVQAPEIPLPEIPTAPGATVQTQPAPDPMDILSLVWFGVMCVTFAYMAVSYSLLRYQIRDAVPCEKGIWETGRIPGAFILGYIWPQIYLPTGLDSVDRQLIIAHEKAHIRRGDVWWKLLGMFCLCIHWYNPLVWLAYMLMSQDIEAACDEQVIHTMPLAQRKAYSYALLNSGKRMAGIFASPVAFSEVNLKQRIKKVLSYRNPGIWISVAAIVLSAFIVVFFMTNQAADQPDSTGQDSTQSTQSSESTQDTTETESTAGTTESTGEASETTGETIHIHNWKDATCSAPKTCTTCGATDGSANDHTYVNRKCTGCGVLLPSEELQFRLNPDQKSYVCTNYLGEDPHVVIPAVYNGLPVTIAGPLRSNRITTVTLPDSITAIADQAFMSEGSLKSITLPSSVTSIGEYAFEDCMHMTSITLSQNLTDIGPYAFARCLSLTEIHIPASVTSIGEGAFQSCFQLQTITFAGTMAQWNAIAKGKDWIGVDPKYSWNFGDTLPVTGVTCSDGFIPF